MQRASDYEGTSLPIFYTQIMRLIGAEGHIMAATRSGCIRKYDSQSKNW